nr:glycosyltransferase family 8 protein [Pectinatus frisingensis]
MGEHLFGIFCLYLKEKKEYKIARKDLVFFQNNGKQKELFPAFNKNDIPVVFGSSNEFVPYACVFVKSVIDNMNNNNNYDFIILEKDISEKNKEIMYKMVKEYQNISIRFYNASNILGDNKFYINSSFQSEVAYYRILAPFILKNYHTKAIVMDCDLIAKCDIAELMEIDLKSNFAGIAKDIVWHACYNGAVMALREYIHKTFPIKNPFNYVNTGVILFDLEKYRTNFTKEEVIKLATSKKFMIQEQDVLNLLLEDKILFLNIEWNMYLPVSPFVKNCIDNYAPIYEKKEYYKAYERPKLLHWAAQPKPWNNPNIDLAEEWWTVARRTPFYEIIIQRLILETNRINHNDYKLSFARKIVDKYFPKETRRREILKFFIPRNSKQWNILKKMYHKISLD